ncbi:AfsR/SARP family transcriptional regulator [Micromonospora sp. NBS 11-29]|uniref:AfsR/SARP family transcriptional regulator n=1 Tax=Micromonospora sp. NBS 11-29 TaxID=1960879 RepID=UPI000B7717D5|nr:tetratricopeptide repeat protein [Micromonospora sp. NBS 11-29]
MWIRLLGQVQLCAGSALVDVGPAQRCLVLAALAADAGRLTPREVLIDRVWGKSPPSGAWRTVQTHITHIRTLLDRIGVPGQTVRVRRGGGYVLDVDPDMVDVHRFRRLVANAARHGPADADRTALWREIMGLWRGEPLAALDGEWVDRTRDAWHGEYRDAVLGWAYAEIRAGDPSTVVGPLTELVSRYPLVEALPAMLMRAHYAAGRRADALDCYTTTRARLEEELAEKPGAELQSVYQAVLRREADLPPPPGVLPAVRAVPAQLPADVRGFAGRRDHLTRLDAIAATVDRDAGSAAVVISAIAGTAGVGKTALAVHWAHQAARRFPDGQLYVNLRGFDPSGAVVEPADAVRGFLDALAVPPERIPADRDAQAALYRTQLADKRMLVVLDNARDTAQVRPLLPGAPGCLVLVTSRDRLTSLVATTGAHVIPLDLLTADEARDVLTRRLGAHRIADEPEAADALAALCARLPLALAIVAARAATNPQLSLTDLVANLTEAGTRLDVLADPDPAADLRAVFSWSYAALTPDAARLFRQLGLHLGADITAEAAASLAGLAPPLVRPLLAELTGASLVVEHIRGRYTLHDLLRAYAAELVHAQDHPEQRRAATHRILDHYLHTAHTACRLLSPAREWATPAPPRPGVTPEVHTDPGRALAWFTTEHAVLLAAIRHAATAGFDAHLWQLAGALAIYLDRQGHWHDLAATQEAALAAAQRLADRPAQAHAHYFVGTAHRNLGHFGEARTQFRRSLDVHEQSGDHAGQATTHIALGLVFAQQGHHRRALDHARRALDLYSAIGHRRGQANALNEVGWQHAQLGNQRQALSYCHQALALQQELGNRAGEAAAWDSIGYAHHHLGHHVRAITCYQRSLDLSRDVGARYSESEVLVHLGDTHLAAGDPEAARIAWRQALTILDDLQHPDVGEVHARLAKLDP